MRCEAMDLLVCTTRRRLGTRIIGFTTVSGLQLLVRATRAYQAGCNVRDERTRNWTGGAVTDAAQMPHVRSREYIVPSPEYELRYVEVIQRHHKVELVY